MTNAGDKKNYYDIIKCKYNSKHVFPAILKDFSLREQKQQQHCFK